LIGSTVAEVAAHLLPFGSAMANVLAATQIIEKLY
jgi:hypothetical protein